MILLPFIMVETRTTVLLTRIARKIRQETGNQRYRARVEDERDSLKHLVYISCTRPLCASLVRPPCDANLVTQFYCLLNQSYSASVCVLTWLILLLHRTSLFQLWGGFTWGVSFCMLAYVQPTILLANHLILDLLW
jgi:hypothetical protein